jgi:sugar phosphate isomerase/epimerase
VAWPIGLIVPMQHATPFSPFDPTDWRDALGCAASAGFDGVELAIVDPHLLDRSAVAEALDAAGLRLLSVTTGQAAGLEGLSLSASDETVRRRTIERIQAHMAFAEPFGAVVIVGSLRGADGDLDLLEESLRACASFNDVTLALEPLNRYESRLLNTVAFAVQLIDRVGRENLGILFDTFHANIEETDPAGAIATAGKRLAHVHLADSNRWVPGYGHIKFADVWGQLEAIGYARSLVLEPLLQPSADALLQAGAEIRSSWPAA